MCIPFGEIQIFPAIEKDGRGAAVVHALSRETPLTNSEIVVGGSRIRQILYSMLWSSYAFLRALCASNKSSDEYLIESRRRESDDRSIRAKKRG